MGNHSNTNRKSALILGATGGFGSALTKVMSNSEWQVKALTRTPKSDTSDANIHWSVGDLNEPETLEALAVGVDVIIHAVNVPYPKWDPIMINYTATIIEVAQRHNAHLIFVGNIYNAGIPANGVISHNTPNAPVNGKGVVRATLERMIKEAADDGLKATVLRFGDFFGPDIPTTNWFNECTKGVSKNQLTIAGPADITHSWAYLPDAAKATEQVASKRLETTDSANYLVLPFRGHEFSFGELQRALQKIKGTPIKLRKMPWKVLTVAGFVIPLLRDVVSMRYLWNHDIRLDGTALTEFLGFEPHHTPLDDILRDRRFGIN